MVLFIFFKGNGTVLRSVFLAMPLRVALFSLPVLPCIGSWPAPSSKCGMKQKYCDHKKKQTTTIAH